MTNPGHSQFCNKHPLHPAVGVCGSCVRERLASLIQSISPEPPAAPTLPPLDHSHKTSLDALALPDLKLRGLNLRNVAHAAANFPPPPDGAATVAPLKNSSACAADIAPVAAADYQPYSPAARFSYGAPMTAAATADNPAPPAAAARESTDPSARWGNDYLTSAASVEWDPATRWSDGHMAAAATAATPLSSSGKKKLGANHTSSWFASFLTRPLILTRVPYGAAAADHQLKSVIACSAASVKKPHPPPPTPSTAAAKFRRRFKAADLQAISEICVTAASSDTSKLGTAAAGSSWLSSFFHRKKSSRPHLNQAVGGSAQNGAGSPDGGSLPDEGSIPARVHGGDAKSGIGKLQITLNISRKKSNGGSVADAVPGSGRGIPNKRDASPARSEDLYMLQQNSRRIEEEAPAAAAATLQRCRSVQHQGSGGGIAMINTSVQTMLSQPQRRERTAAAEAEAPLSHAAIYNVAKQRRKEWDEEDEDEEVEAEAAEEQLRRYVQHDWGGSGSAAEEEEVQRSMAAAVAGNFSRSRSWGRAWNRRLSPVLWGLGTATVGRSTSQEGRLMRRSQQTGSGDEAEGGVGVGVEVEVQMGGGRSRRRRRQQDVAAAAAVAVAEKHRGYDSSSAAQSYVSPLRRTIPALDMRIHSAQ